VVAEGGRAGIHQRLEQLRAVIDDEDRDLDDALRRSAHRLDRGNDVAEGLLGLRIVILPDQLPIGVEADLAAHERDLRTARNRDVAVGRRLVEPFRVCQLDCH
jgi:hypothetical protein